MKSCCLRDEACRAAHTRSGVSRETSNRRPASHRPGVSRETPGRAQRVLVFAAALVALSLIVGCGRLDAPEGWAAPVVDRDLVLVQRDRGVLSAGSLSETGRFTPQWEFPAEGDDYDLDGIYATPLIDGAAIYVIGFSGTVVSLDRNTGRPLWAVAVVLDAHTVATPVIDGEYLYVPTEKGELVAIRRDTGFVAERHSYGGGRFWAQPLVVNRTIYLGQFDDRRLLAVDPTNGQVLWEESLPGGVAADLLFSGGRLIVGGLDRSVHAFDIASTPTKAWSFEADGWIVANPLAAGDTVYVGTLGGSTYALDIATGRVIWQYQELGLEFRSRPSLIGGVLVVADREGNLRGLNPTNGQVLWARSLNDTQLFADPTERDSRLLFISRDGDLILVTPSDGTVVREDGSGV